MAFFGISRNNQGFPLSIKTDVAFSLTFTWSTEGLPCFLRAPGPLLQKHAIAMLLAWPQEVFTCGPIWRYFKLLDKKSTCTNTLYVEAAPVGESSQIRCVRKWTCTLLAYHTTHQWKGKKWNCTMHVSLIYTRVILKY